MAPRSSYAPPPPTAAPAAPSAPPPPPSLPPTRHEERESATLSPFDPASYTLSAPSPPRAEERRAPDRSALDASAYTLSNGAGTGGRPVSGKGIIPVDDVRWKFQQDAALPKPREFHGIPKKYRAGRGSSVPLDLSALR